MKNNRLLLCGCAAAAFIGAHNSALAQPASAAAPPAAKDNKSQLDEIVVQARRVAENQQSVPISITTLSTDQLERQSVTQMYNLEKAVPLLIVSNNPIGGQGQVTYILRGVSPNVLTDASVVSYFDEVAVDPRGFQNALYDLQSVQVLKGPQGTLFGKNSDAGAILFVPHHPTDQFDGYIQSRVGNFAEHNLQAMVNIPISEKIAFRVASDYERRDGWQKSVTSPLQYDNRNRWSVRASVNIKLASNLENYTSYTHNNLREYSQAQTLIGFFAAATGPCATSTPYNCIIPPNDASLPALAAQGYPVSLSKQFAIQQGLGKNRTVSNFPAKNFVDYDAVTNITSWEAFDGLNVKNIAYYGRTWSLGGLANNGSQNRIDDINDQHNVRLFSNELQVRGKAFGSTLDWVIGGYYSSQRDRQLTDAYQMDFLPNNSGHTIKPILRTFDTYAVFGQANLHLDALVPGLTITGGIRHTWDKKGFSEKFGRSEVYGGPTTGCGFIATTGVFPAAPMYDAANCTLNLSDKWDATNYNITANWQINNDIMLYVARRRGYKAGGFQSAAIYLGPDGSGFSYDPEYIQDWEFGAKTEFHVGTMPVRFNAAYFISNYTAIQSLFVTTDGQAASAQIVNKDAVTGRPNRARIKGIELELTAKPVPWLTLSANYAKYSARYVDTFRTSVAFRTPAGVTFIPGADLKGQSIAGTVPEAYGANATINLPETPISGGGFLTANYSHRSPALTNSASNTQATLFARDLLDARFGLTDVGGVPLDVSLWVVNLTNERSGPRRLASASQPTSIELYYEPRTYGLSMKYRFGAGANR